MNGWRVESSTGPAAELLEASAALVGGPTPPRRTIRFLRPVAPALVLGSSQPESVVDRRQAAAAGVEIVRRRSGGGAVLADPATVVWVDVVLPAGDRLWDDDVGRAALWLGRCWAKALQRAGAGPASPWEGSLQRRRWSELVCFAGLGPAEVTVEGKKAVGLSQRRTRHGALFQCAVLLRWDPEAVLSLLDLDAASRRAAAADLANAALGVGPGMADVVSGAFLDCLPA